MGRGPDREPLHHLVCARLPHDDRDRGDARRPGHGATRAHPRRPRRVRRLRRSVEMARRFRQHRHRILRLPGRASFRRRRLHQQGARRRRLSLLVPRHRSRLCDRTRDGHHGAEAGARSRRLPHQEFHQARAVSLQFGARLGIRFGRLSHRHAEGARRHRLSQAAGGAEGEARGVQARRDARAHGDRRRLLHRDRRRGPIEELRHLGHCDVRFLRDPHPSDRQGHRAHGHEEPGPGPRDHLGADHRHRDRHSRRRHRGRGRQHRHRALRPRHLWIALNPGRRGRDRHGRAQGQGQSANDRRLHARSARGRSRMGRRSVPRQGQSGDVPEP